MGQVLEEGIAGTRNEDLVAGIGQQLEQQRVRVAGARGENNLIRGNRDALSLVLARHGLTGSGHAPRVRLVDERAIIRKRRQQIRRVIEAGACRVGQGQVDDRAALCAHIGQRPRQPVRRQITGQS